MSETRCALIVGDAGGVGRACADRLAGEGFTVESIPVPTATPEAARAALGAAVDKLGGLDALVWCGASDARPGMDAAGTPTWTELRANNLDALFCVIQAGAGRMLDNKTGGRITCVLSDDAIGECADSPLHAATAWGARGLVRNFAAELARQGIAVNAVCPTTQATQAASTPLGTLPTPADVANTVAFTLCNVEHMTGQAIPLAAGAAML